MLGVSCESEGRCAGHVTQQGVQVQLQHGPAPWLAYKGKWGSTVEAPALQEWFAKAENPVSRSWLAQASFSFPSAAPAVGSLNCALVHEAAQQHQAIKACLFMCCVAE